MNCEQARNLFDAYLDGELSAGLATELGAHRLACPSCRRALALMEVAGHVIGSDVDRLRLEESFTDRLMHCIDEQGPSARRHRPLWRIGAGVLAAAACVLFVFKLVNQNETRVAGFRDQARRVEEAPLVESEVAAGQPDTVDLTEAADRWTQQIDSALTKTHRSAGRLLQLGGRSLIRLVEPLDDNADPAAVAPAESGAEPASAPQPLGPPDNDAIEDL